MDNLADWLTASEAAQVLGIHRNNVLKAIREQRLPAVRKGGRVYLIRRADVDAYKARRESGGEEP